MDLTEQAGFLEIHRWTWRSRPASWRSIDGLDVAGRLLGDPSMDLAEQAGFLEIHRWT
jgi:hypothetical protein